MNFCTLRNPNLSWEIFKNWVEDLVLSIDILSLYYDLECVIN